MSCWTKLLGKNEMTERRALRHFLIHSECLCTWQFSCKKKFCLDDDV
jgi:hypothetical protein